MKRTLLILCIAFLYLPNFAQKITSDVISNGGEIYFKNEQGSISWTLGEIVSESFKTNTNNVTLGFQQSQINIVGIKEIEGVTVSIYPNPTTSIINVEIQGKSVSHFAIYSLNGQQFAKGRLNDTSTQINLSSFPASTYILRLTDDKRIINVSYTVVKTK